MSLKMTKRPNCVPSRSGTLKGTMWLLLLGCNPAKWSYSKEWTRSRMDRGLTSKPQVKPPIRPAAAAAAVVVDVAAAAGAAKGTGNEYFAAIHSPACSNVVTDCRCPSGRRCCIQTVAGVGIAASGLSDHSGCDVLSRSEPGCDVVFGYRSTRTSVRTSPRFETDDVLELVRVLCHHASVFTGSEH